MRDIFKRRDEEGHVWDIGVDLRREAQYSERASHVPKAPPRRDAADAMDYGLTGAFRRGEVGPNAFRDPGPQLDVRTYDGPITAAAVLLYDRKSGEVLPGQVRSDVSCGVDRVPEITVTFKIDGSDIRMGNNTHEHAAKADQAMEEADAANDLQAAFRAWGGLTEANQDRFMAALGLRWHIEGEEGLAGLFNHMLAEKRGQDAETIAKVFAGPDAEEVRELERLRQTVKTQRQTIKTHRERGDRMAKAVAWALGELDDFKAQGTQDPAYWWRKELRRRAFGERSA